MYRQIVINAIEHETRVAVLEDGNIAELFIERHDESNIAGNIYKGRVQRVLPGMQAAFIDIGLNQAAFLYVDDIVENTLEVSENMFNTEDFEQAELSLLSPEEDQYEKKPLIEERLAEDQEVMVQVAKSPIGTKGARVTTHITLPGRYLVLMPTSSHIGISRRIENEEERNRLKELISEIRENNIGYIIRTVAEGVKREKLVQEKEFLNKMWAKIQQKHRRASAPSLLHRELSVILRAVRDLLIHDAGKMIIDSKTGYEEILNFLNGFMPSLKSCIEVYDEKEPIFEAYNLETEISRALKRKVWLKSGGYIVIEHTEALIAIDVNTGRYVGKHNLEETILKTNLEAVKEIAYQIRLRDIGGIIIIDFIDMEKPTNREKVFNAFKEALKKDRSKTHVLPMSDMGLIQMTRKRIRKSLNRMLCEPCHYCDGEGYLLSGCSICYAIYREILRDSNEKIGTKLTLRVNPIIADLLHGEENDVIISLEKRINKQINIYPNNKFHIEEFDFYLKE